MAQVDLVDTIARVAGVGTRLSIALYTFSETVAITTTPLASSASSSSSSSSTTITSSASYKARDLARDVSLTCSVLAELRANLKPQDHDHDDSHESHDNGKAKLDSNADADSDSDATLKIAKEIVVECGTVFRDMDALVARAVESSSSSSKGAVIMEMDHLGGNLDRIKRTLLMMLSDLLNAADSTDEKESSSKDHNDDDDDDDDNASSRTLLGNMLRANEEARKNHQPALNATGSRDNARPGDSTIQSCLRHIGNALLRFEHTSSATQHPSRVRVRIELEKVFGPSRYQPGRPNPWVVRSIVRSTAHPRPEYAVPSNPEPDMYSSVAAGALESLNIEDYDEPQYYSRAPAYRSDGAGRGPALAREAQQPLDLSERGQGQRRSSQKPWYSSVWESLPSPTTAMGSIQETIKKTSLLFGADEESGDPDPGLKRNQPRVGAAVPPQILEQGSAKITRSPTFDDILLSPSNKGQSTSPPPATNFNLERTADSTTRPSEPKTAEEPAKHDSPDLSAPVASTAEPSKEASGSSVDNPAGKESADQKDLDTVYQPPKP
ncbi:hypothetical protein Z517_03539 [Fonsecaea pedrosoi CBS 271.37]|uniref:Fungal N-terminal domain-containing protein n=1 Tax=Fonsecaea pedrosoi CBS 271.37 TaxID=1442368 RepID=A0A0D2HII9_9EURO|nr:uncharacterized protein Z517_03539 [Fonsecaea pedrosoi CBS 271.37]KIW84289.1 hypothetical protein Z517_03539 [Fonsecaea pedrosoi CBS 271.37]